MRKLSQNNNNNKMDSNKLYLLPEPAVQLQSWGPQNYGGFQGCSLHQQDLKEEIY